MYLRKCRKKGHQYWALVESYRSERGPRQRVVAYLGQMEAALREGVAAAADERPRTVQRALWDEDLEPDWQEIDTHRLRVERTREFGAWWVGLWLFEKLGLPELLDREMPRGNEDVPWSVMAMILVLCRLCHPSSELAIAETYYERSALPDLLGVAPARVNDDRLYRALDRLLEHKEALEEHLRDRLGKLFEIEFDVLLYDITSTYFEGSADGDPLAQRGYSRDSRPDCKQVCIALVVSRCGLPLGYEVFPGSTADVTTVEEIVGAIERRHGRADRIWVMDRGMASEANLAFLREDGRRYILGSPRTQLRQFEGQIAEGGWSAIRDGLEVKLCPAPSGEETFILCRSRDRKEKEAAIHRRFEERIETGLKKLEQQCASRRLAPTRLAQQIGRLLERNHRAARLFKTEVRAQPDGSAKLVWSKAEELRAWSELTEGCYLLRTNIKDWTDEELWRAYIQLTQAEAAFRIQKSDLSLRPIWHQKEERVRAHILVCFLAYVLWKTLSELCSAAGLGQEPRRVLDEIAQVRQVDVILRTRSGIAIRRRCITRPDPAQAVLLAMLKMQLPSQLKLSPDEANVV